MYGELTRELTNGIGTVDLAEPYQSRRVTINLENGQVKTFWYAYVLNILLHLYTRIYPRKLEVK